MFRGGKTASGKEETAGINFIMPDGRSENIEKDKMKALDKVGSDESVKPGIPITDDITDRTDPVPQHDPYSAYRNLTAQLNSFDNNNNDKQTIRQLEQEIERLNQKLESSDGHNRTREEIIEESMRIAQKMMQEEKLSGEEYNEVSRIKEILPVRTISTSDKTVSTLGRLTLSEYLDDSRATDFITPVGKPQSSSSNTISACVDHEQTLTSGSPVKLRILENVMVGEYLVPANSVLTGTGFFGPSQRLEITVESIELNGNIIPVELVVHDKDGQRGLYVPVSTERNAAKDAAGAMANSFGTGITISRDAKQQVAMDLARSAITGGTQYVSSKIREIRITLKPEYRVLLISSK